MVKAHRTQASRPDRARELASSGHGPVKSYKMSPDELEDYRAKTGFKEPADQQAKQPKKGIDIPVNTNKPVKNVFLECIARGHSISNTAQIMGLKPNGLAYWVKKWDLVGITPEKAKAILHGDSIPSQPEDNEVQNVSMADYEKKLAEWEVLNQELQLSRSRCQELEADLEKWKDNDTETQELLLEITAERDQRERDLLDAKQELFEMTEDRDNWKLTAQEVKQAIAELEEERQLLLETIERAAGTSHQDNVNNPAHYTQGGIETIDFIRAKLTPEEFEGYCKGNVLKYVARASLKGGHEDLRKAGKYIEFAVGE